MVAQIELSLCFLQLLQHGWEKASLCSLLRVELPIFVTHPAQNSKDALKCINYVDCVAQRTKTINQQNASAWFCNVLSSCLKTVSVHVGPWPSGQISIQHWIIQRLSEVWRRSKGSGPALSSGSWTGLCDISIGYWLRSTALWAPSPSRLHSVTPTF